MNEMHMHFTYWVGAIHTAVHIMNRTPTTTIHQISLYENYGMRPIIAYMKVFSCICYVHVHGEMRKKLEPKAVKCIFLGCPIE